jgi:hypothetical protein
MKYLLFASLMHANQPVFPHKTGKSASAKMAVSVVVVHEKQVSISPDGPMTIYFEQEESLPPIVNGNTIDF